MKTELEQQDIESIAQKVLELLSPMLSRKRTDTTSDDILDVKRLSDYLKVDVSWIYKQVQLNTIPYFKVGKYTRFKKSAIDKHLEKSMMPAVSPVRIPSRPFDNVSNDTGKLL